MRVYKRMCTGDAHNAHPKYKGVLEYSTFDTHLLHIAILLNAKPVRKISGVCECAHV